MRGPWWLSTLHQAPVVVSHGFLVGTYYLTVGKPYLFQTSMSCVSPDPSREVSSFSKLEWVPTIVARRASARQTKPCLGVEPEKTTELCVAGGSMAPRESLDSRACSAY